MGIKSSSKSFSKDQVRYNSKAGIALDKYMPNRRVLLSDSYLLWKP